MNIFASNLLAKREEKRFTQSYVAMLCGMSQPNYSDIERGKTNPSIRQLKKFAEVFGTTVDELISDKPNHQAIKAVSSAPKKNILAENDKDTYIRILEDQLRVLLKDKEKPVQ